MIFEELVLHNFGVYKGRHTIALTPKSEDKPIVLIGALNGSGKTTFLDALQLALYGKFANCSNRGNLSYHDFLRKTINHWVDPADGASLELQFRHTRGGHDETYRVTRVWRSTGKTIREDVEVSREGKFDPVLTERWYEYVDEFIPAPISSLFFFDGEKIEGLAETTSSTALVRTGIHALLGLDLVDQLSKDLIVVENRRRAKLQSQDEQSELCTIDAAIAQLESKRSHVNQQRGGARNEVDRLEKEESRLRDLYRQAGGELYERREALESELRSVKHRLEDADGKLRDLAAGTAPLLIVQELVESAFAQARRERGAALHTELHSMLVERDVALMRVLRTLEADTGVVDEVADYLQKDLQAREQHSACEVYLNTEPLVFGSLRAEGLAEIAEAIEKQVAHREQIAEQVAALQRQLAGIPADEAIAEINGKLEQSLTDKNRAELRLEVIDGELEKLDAELDAKRRERQRHLERVAARQIAEETNQRVLKHAEKSRKTLDLFRKIVAQRHTARLEDAILESFGLLLRKKGLVSRLNIDPESYELTLFSEEGNPVSPERLSAGERQLLAVAILWGLAKASGRPLPCIIDTPLGRLDSTHRKHLVEHYFPFASHQVILLSTDEEISGDYHRSLKRAIGREYVIRYDEAKGTSAVSPGYFH